MDKEQRETIEAFKGMIQQTFWDGGARCRICNEWFGGNDLGEILAKLGRHGEEKHPEVFRQGS